MPRRGNRRKIATNVYDDKTGRVIIYRDHDGRQRELRYPPHTPIADMRADVVALLAQSSGSGIPKAAKDTLAAAVDAWEPLEQGLASWKERRSELRAWVRAEVNGKPLGQMPIRQITEAVCRRVMAQWAQRKPKPVAPKTIRQRRWSLQHLYRVLYGKKAKTPVDDIPPPPIPRRVPTWIAPSHVLAVYANLLEQEQRGILRDAKTRARFMVRASTGRRPAEIMRAQPDDVQLERREWRVRDAKGGWSPGIYLNDDQLAAWQLFIEADAWGAFNTGSMARVLRTAGWHPHTRPYELRHNVAMAMMDAGLPLDDASAQLGHKDLHTTRRTYAPIRASRMQRASEAIQGRFGGWQVDHAIAAPPVPASVPANGVKQRGSTGRKIQMVKVPISEGKPAKPTRKTGRK
jgi:integrase